MLKGQQKFRIQFTPVSTGSRVGVGVSADKKVIVLVAERPFEKGDKVSKYNTEVATDRNGNKIFRTYLFLTYNATAKLIKLISNTCMQLMVEGLLAESSKPTKTKTKEKNGKRKN